MYRRLTAIWLLVLFCGAAFAAGAVKIGDIRIVGLERVSKGAVFAHLPVDVGDTVKPGVDTSKIIRSLYKSGFFDDIKLGFDGDTLVIKVRERPAIASIAIEGNKSIDTDTLKEALRKAGIDKGRVFDRSVLDSIERELRQQYFSQGKYNVRIESEVKPLDGNRVDLAIRISEGVVTRIRRVEIIGNEHFSDEELMKNFNSGVPSWWAFLSSKDKYSKQKLEADLEILRAFYMDRGFLNFSIDSTQVTLTPDKKDLYITINVSEGDRFTVRDVEIKGKSAGKADKLAEAVEVEAGETFSRSKIADSIRKMKDELGGEGFAFANVNVLPRIDEEDNEVALDFVVDPGKRVYVREIRFYGNAKTRDEVFRREMRQLEGSWYSSTKIKRSRVRIQRLPFVETVNIERKRVPGRDDLVDLEVTVTERLAGSFSAGLGYSQAEGLLLNLAFSQENAFGSGKRLSVNFNNSSSNTVYSVSYTNPYYTIDGVSRGFNAFYRKTDAGKLDVVDYIADRWGLGVSYGIPLTEYDGLRFSLNYENILIKTSDRSPQEIRDFVAVNGDEYDEFTVNSTFTHDTRDRTVFATEGNLQRLRLEVAAPGSDLDYYKLSYRNVLLFPFGERYALQLMGDVAYGDSYNKTTDLPFFEKYYAGGIRSVRGYRANSLGPLSVSTDDPFGGNFRTLASMEFFFPAPFAKDNRSVRMGAFVDAGNVFKDVDDFDENELRASAGLSFEWLSPVGPLVFSLADTLNEKEEDRVQQFQFSIGASF